jgi:MFS family permease
MPGSADPDGAASAARAAKAARAEQAARAARAVAHGVAATGRITVRGGRAGARIVGKSTREGTRRFRAFAGADGAGESGLARLTEMQAVTAAGDAAFTISLASTVLALPVGQARGQVAVFLLTTMAPFVLLAPFIGPVLDRFRHGRRWAIGATVAIRAFLSWVLAGVVGGGSAWLLPVALVCLLAARAYAVTRAAAIPLVLPSQISLVTANSRQSIAALVGMIVGSAIAGPVGRIGAEWSLRVAFVIYVLATIQAIRLPAQVDSQAPDGSGVAGALPARPGRARRSLGGHRPMMPTSVRATLAACTGARLLAGFVTLFLAFLLREHPLDGISSVLALGLVVGAAGVGNAVGSFVGNRLGNRSPSMVATGMLLLATATSLVTALFYSLWTLLALGLVAGAFGQLAKLCLDALIQHETAEHVQSRVFSRAETRLQAAWVIGGALGIAIPLSPGFGFGVVTALLALTVAGTVVIRRGSMP